MRFLRAIGLAAASALAASLLLAAGASAAGGTITVTSKLDGADGGNCTLREAITTANNNSVGATGCVAIGTLGDPDTITFDPTVFPAGGAVETINLTADGPAISTDVTIQGYGMGQLTVDGNAPAGRVFNVNAGTATISGMKITGGQPPAATAFGGGIANFGSLELDGVCVCGNHVVGSSAASGTAALANGAGIYSSTIGSVTIQNSVIDDNDITATQSAASGSDLAAAVGAGMYFAGGTASITNSTISNNDATATKTGSTASAQANSGGLFVAGAALTMERSTLNANQVHATATGTASASGGAIELYGTSTGSIELSTIANNRTDTGSGLNQRGAGIYVESDGLLAIVSSTIARNGTSAVLSTADGKNIDDVFGANTISNSIVSDPAGGGGNCNLNPGSLTSLGYSDDYTPTAGHTGTCGFVGATDSGADPLLDPIGLAANGGDTETIALLPGSPMIDKGSNAGQTSPGIDQRGSNRPSDFLAVPNTANGTDIGAFELLSPDQPPANPPPAAGPTGQRAAALKKCKKKKSKKARTKCKKKAKKLPV
jgi:CSLREA domain-containing protein